MLDRHGPEDAADEVVRRVNTCLARHDVVGANAWYDVLAALADLLETPPKDGAPRN
jgi:hypothetical protein